MMEMNFEEADNESIKSRFRIDLIMTHLISGLNVGHLGEVIKILNNNDHIMAFKNINKKLLCNDCQDLAKLHPRDKILINHNSRRCIHHVLFWLKLLGVNYPLNDYLINHSIFISSIKNVCQCGIALPNGHSVNKFRICINPAHYACSSHAIKMALYFNIDVLHLNIDILNPSAEFRSFINTLVVIKEQGNVFQIIDLIRSQCPPVNRYHKKDFIDTKSLYDGSHYKLFIDNESDLKLRTLEVVALCGNQDFRHYCNIDGNFGDTTDKLKRQDRTLIELRPKRSKIDFCPIESMCSEIIVYPRIPRIPSPSNSDTENKEMHLELQLALPLAISADILAGARILFNMKK
jgi:hypothetical protein